MAATTPLRVSDLIHKYGWDIMPYLSNLGVKTLAEAQVLFVDSGATNALDADDGVHGHSLVNPLATIDYAIGLCTASEGAVILVAPGHNESLDNATIDFDVAGVTCIGLGEGTLRPRIDYDHASSSVDIGANNVTLINLTFLPSAASVLIGVDVESAVTNFKMINCEFLPYETSGDEFVVAVDLKANNHDSIIKDNKFWTEAAAGASTHGIKLTAGSSRVQILNNIANGNYSTAFIASGAAVSEILIKENDMKVKDGEPGIELFTGSTGLIIRNNIESTGVTVDNAIVADACSWFDNKCVATDGTASEIIGGGDIAADLVTYQLDHLAKTADGTGAYPATVANDSIIAMMLSKSNPAAASSYDNTTDSLEALSDQVKKIDGVTISTTPTAASLASFIASGGTSLGTQLPVSTSLYDTTKNVSTVGVTGAPVASTLADTLHKDGSFTYDNTTDSLEAIRDKINDVDNDLLGVERMAGVFYVDANIGASGAGDSWATAFKTITEALAVATTRNDKIYVAPGDYDEGATLAITTQGLQIIGPGPETQNKAMIYDGLSAGYDLMTIDAHEVVIDGLAFSAVANTFDGIVVGGTSSAYKVTIRNCRLDGWSGEYGIQAGAANDCPDILIENNLFRSWNTAAVQVNCTRSCVRNNLFHVVTDCIGLEHVPAGGDRPDNVYLNNRFSGIANASTTGIKFTGAPSNGTCMCGDNLFFGTWDTTITQVAAYIGVHNYVSDNAGGDTLVDTVT